MKKLVVFDSLYGNTKKIAKAVADGLGEDTYLRHVGKLEVEDLDKYDFVVFGAPTHGGFPKEEMAGYLKELKKQQLKGKKVAVFDTRTPFEGSSFFIKFVMKVLGFAASKMKKMMNAKGAELVVKPEGFIVEGKEGPLRKGEVERARKWGEETRVVFNVDN